MRKKFFAVTVVSLALLMLVSKVMLLLTGAEGKINHALRNGSADYIPEIYCGIYKFAKST